MLIRDVNTHFMHTFKRPNLIIFTFSCAKFWSLWGTNARKMMLPKMRNDIALVIFAPIVIRTCHDPVSFIMSPATLPNQPSRVGIDLSGMRCLSSSALQFCSILDCTTWVVVVINGNPATVRMPENAANQKYGDFQSKPKPFCTTESTVARVLSSTYE